LGEPVGAGFASDETISIHADTRHKKGDPEVAFSFGQR
jgi:hypothetical protein